MAVVDDEQEMREKLCEYLSRYAYEEALEFKIEKYSNGFDLFSQQAFADIIFLDIEMDNMNGMESGAIVFGILTNMISRL